MPNNLLHDTLSGLTAATIDASREFLFPIFRENQNLLNEKNDEGHTPFDLFANLATEALKAEVLRRGNPGEINSPFSLGSYGSTLITEFFSPATNLDAALLHDLSEARAKNPPKPTNLDNAVRRVICFQMWDACREAVRLQAPAREAEMTRYLGIERPEELDGTRFRKLLDLYPGFGRAFIESFAGTGGYEESRKIEKPALDILKEKGFLLNIMHIVANGMNDTAVGLLKNEELLGLINVDARSEREYFQNTALHLLAAKNWEEKNSDGIELELSNAKFAEMLVCHFGADPNLQNDKGHTALDIAVARRSEEMVLAICKSQKLTGETIKKAFETLGSTTYERSLVMVTQECLTCCHDWESTEESEKSLSYRDQCLPLRRDDYSDEKRKKLEEILRSTKVIAPSVSPETSGVEAVAAAAEGVIAVGGGGGGGGGGR